MELKKCSKCGNQKCIGDFTKKRRARDGLDNWCKNCNKEYKKQYKENNREKIKKRKKDWYNKNRERENKRKREKYRTDEYKTTRNAYIKNNREHITEMHKIYVENNREKVRENNRASQKNRYKNDLNYRISVKIRNRLNDAIKKYSNGKQVKTINEYNIDFVGIIRVLGPQPGPNFVIDHIIPISYFNFNDPIELRAAFLPINHRWLDRIENSKKCNKILTDEKFLIVKREIDEFIEKERAKTLGTQQEPAL